VGDMGEIHPEALQLYLMSGFFIGLGQLAVAAHQEDPGGYPRHPGGGVDSVTNNNDWSTFRFCLRRPKPDRSKAETHPHRHETADQQPAPPDLMNVPPSPRTTF